MNATFNNTARHLDALRFNALRQNLRRLLLIRAIVFALQLMALLCAWRVLQLPLDYGLIFAIFFTLALVNGALYWRLQQHQRPHAPEFFAHLLIDVLGLWLLLYFTGGASNPFISYLLVPVTIAAATLSLGYTLALVACALACYSLLLFFYTPLPALMPADAGAHTDHGSSAQVANLHVLGMWFNFLVSAALITYFVVKMAADNQRQQARLRQYREDTLRNEQILAVAILAAGTAHELGTPLGSMAVLLKELRQQHLGDAALDQDLKLLQDQVARCRDALRTLAQKADFKNLEAETLPLNDFLQHVMQQWQLLRPEVACTFQIQAGTPPAIEVDATLQQALINMLNNAADSSPQGFELRAQWHDTQWTLLIRDFGAGISAALAAQLGTHFLTTKTDGMGVGLVLSQATVNRLGGTVNLFPLEAGGTLTQITLPLHLPRAANPETHHRSTA
ncbi:MAG: sensor histidine kinase [Pseudomonadales bacterium]|jgi:two-component system sensor histidine kinase RegB|nr:sensor histidine kinase [Pseudomonadales bacterium]